MHSPDETDDSVLTPIPGSEIALPGTIQHTNATDDSVYWLLANVNDLGRTTFSFDQVRAVCDDLKINPILLEQAIRTGDMAGEAVKGSLLQTFYEVLEENVMPSSQVAEPATVTEASIREATRILASAHQHSFTYLLNQGHNALRGCPCGLSFVGLMAGNNADELRWHRIKEEGEE